MPQPPREVSGYRLGVRLGKGSFGEVYRGRRGVEEVAVKLEHKSNKPRLLAEADFIANLADGLGIPRIYWCGEVGSFNAMVMELLGPSLWDHFRKCGRLLSLKTVLMCGDQMIQRLQLSHERGILHRDIKPHNFLVGRGWRSSQIYLVDFGLSKTYMDKHGKHIAFKDGRKGLTGTARYTSINNHLGIEPTRRDDLEGVGYVLVHMVRGSLPWQGIQAETKAIRNDRIKAMKLSISVEELCKDLPPELAEYMSLCRGLGYDEEPPYDYLRSLMSKALERNMYRHNLVFDWSVSSESGSESSGSSSTSSTAESKNRDRSTRKRKKPTKRARCFRRPSKRTKSD